MTGWRVVSLVVAVHEIKCRGEDRRVPCQIGVWLRLIERGTSDAPGGVVVD